MYDYRASIKSDSSDELINTWLLRPAAGLIVWPLCYSPVSPNHVTAASTLAGFLAAWFFLQGHESFAVAGLLVTLKDLLDSADGQLARAKKQYSRIGRFLDSIGDILVNAAVFAAIGWSVSVRHGDPMYGVLALAGFLGISLRVSFHVFYQSQYLHSINAYANNRIEETVTKEDRSRGGTELMLQRLFQFFYGWQDRLMMRIDLWSRKGNTGDSFSAEWSGDHRALRLSGFLGLGTELFLLMICSVAGTLELYLLLNLFLMNGIWIIAIIYRRAVLLPGFCSHISAELFIPTRAGC